MDLLSGALSLGSGLLSFWGQERTNAANAALAERQMAFQQNMSSSSYQRAVEDMKAAGLNPMLAYSQGGAASPGGSTAVMQNSLGAGVSSANQARLLESQDELLKDQASKTRAESEVAREQAREIRWRNQREEAAWLYRPGESLSAYIPPVYQAQFDKALSEAGVPQAQIRELSARARRLHAESVLAELERAGAEREADLYRSRYGAVRPLLRDVSSAAQSAASAASAARGVGLTVPRSEAFIGRARFGRAP